LHIAQELVHLLGGTISVQSELGRGSTFAAWLPGKKP
jgi:signal transduction histidine kinase